MNVFDLVKKLISIPSYRSSTIDESIVGEFLFDYLSSNFKIFKNIKKQGVQGKRFNIIAGDGDIPKVIFCCHVDTVSPVAGWKHDPLKPVVEGDKIIGLGAKDMKGGIAALLESLTRLKKTRGLMLLFYVGEESDLAGIKALAKNYSLKPKLLISPESNFQIANAHRGLVQLELVVKGKPSHAARPHLGQNAITGGVKALEALSKILGEVEHPLLGKASVNLAYLQGGSTDQLNVIPGATTLGLDIRMVDPTMNSEKVVSLVRACLKMSNLDLAEFEILADYAPSSTGKKEKELKTLVDSIESIGEKPVYAKAARVGFNDVQILAEKFGCGFVNFGPAGGNNHAPDEYVSIKSLLKVSQVFEKFIKKTVG